MASAESPPIQLLDLDDAYLQEIFSYLTMQEAFSLFGLICNKIDNIILLKLSETKHITIDLGMPPLFLLQQLEVLGCNIDSLELISSRDMAPSIALNYLIPICYQRNLQNLILCCVQCNQCVQQCLLEVAAQLHNLVFNNCLFTSDVLVPILRKCRNLRTLRFFGTTDLTCSFLNCVSSDCFEFLQLQEDTVSLHELQRYIRWNPQMPSSSSEDQGGCTTQLLDLNDDCLLEIFKYLSIQETFSLLGWICQRIDNIIYESLSRVKHLSISLRDPPQFTTEQLEILGCHLTSIYISAGYSLSSILTLNYLEPICEEKNLQLLTLHYVHFNEQFQQCLIKVAAKLHFLDLSYCQLTDDLLGPVLEKCNNLRTLAIFGNYKLKCVSLNSLKSSDFQELKVEQNVLNKREIQKFKENNPHVTITIFSIGNLDHFRNNLA